MGRTPPFGTACETRTDWPRNSWSMRCRRRTEPAALAWRFVSRGVLFNDVFLRSDPLLKKTLVERRFDRWRIRIRNQGEPCHPGLEGRRSRRCGMDGPAGSFAPRDWRWIEFPWDLWHVASWSRDANGKLDFPISHIAIIAFDLKPGREYRLQVQRLEVVSPDRPVATVHELSVPDHLRAGQNVAVSVSVTLDRPCSESDAALIFQRGATTLTRVALPLPRHCRRSHPAGGSSSRGSTYACPSLRLAGRRP